MASVILTSSSEVSDLAARQLKSDTLGLMGCLDAAATCCVVARYCANRCGQTSKALQSSRTSPDGQVDLKVSENDPTGATNPKKVILSHNCTTNLMFDICCATFFSCATPLVVYIKYHTELWTLVRLARPR